MRITLTLLASAVLSPMGAFGQHADYGRDWYARACVHAPSYEYPVSSFERRHNESMLDWDKRTDRTHIYGYIPPSTHPNVQWFMRFRNRHRDEDAYVHIALFNDAGYLVQEGHLGVAPQTVRGINPTTLPNLRSGSGTRLSDNFISYRVEPGPHELLWARVSSTYYISTNVFVRVLSGEGSGFLSRIKPMFLARDRDRFSVRNVNPASNHKAVGIVRLVNTYNQPRTVTLRAWDDQTQQSGDVACDIPACAALTLTAEQLETGPAACNGRFGDGTGKWWVEDAKFDGQGPMRILAGVRNSALGLFAQYLD